MFIMHVLEETYMLHDQPAQMNWLPVSCWACLLNINVSFSFGHHTLSSAESLVVSELERFFIRLLVCLLRQQFFRSAPLASQFRLVKTTIEMHLACFPSLSSHHSQEKHFTLHSFTVRPIYPLSITYNLVSEQIFVCRISVYHLSFAPWYVPRCKCSFNPYFFPCLCSHIPVVIHPVIFLLFPALLLSLPLPCSPFSLLLSQ